uniref:Uncharacterized protein n=1 Tax=Anguilla anguilla TaxID=7936 RepID=A0A0E9SXR8_ANGAN
MLLLACFCNHSSDLSAR